ncbi:MAG: outer membrane lipoprotein-sorting protein [Spirochaetes bacterium]|nr:outer membrane lipoprotein-sorting protein [Spirochaetota bacterium]
MKKCIVSLLTIIFVSFLAQNIFALTPEEILNKVDDNEVFDTIKYSGVMTIKKGSRRRPRVKTFQAVARGKDKAYIEFTNPGDRGTKYLKLGDELWIKGTYAERADKISGHKLRDSMMGSDYSYEDTMDNEKLVDRYKATIAGAEKVSGHDCYELDLEAKVKEITYARLKIWVDKEQFVAMKIQYFALSGMLLKEMTVDKVKKINERYFPIKVRMVNKQRKDSYTLFEMKSIVLDEPVSESMFSKQQLEK